MNSLEEKRYFAVYYFKDSPEATDVFIDRYNRDVHEIAEKELKQCDTEWNKIDLYDITGNEKESYDISLDDCGQCVASLTRDDIVE